MEGNTAYEYDELGQLAKEIRNAIVNESSQITGSAVDFEYDRYGNIVTKDNKFYVYGKYYKNNVIGGEIEETLDWKDLLTYYNGQRINYDDQGNPTNYMGTELVWEKGRQLKQFGSNSYTYNNDGVRTSKTIDGVKHAFVLDGSNIVKETWGGNTLIPLYDLDGTVCGIKYNGTAYYFYKNLQGDVIAITNDAGATIARYTYDAWGKVLSVKDAIGNGIVSASHIANINPFRYRGYYYDVEVGLYYLQSRYYDPNNGRFINADNAKYILKNDSVLSNNSFCYCCNDSVNAIDFYGTIAVALLIAQIILITATILTGIIVGRRAVKELQKTESYKRSIGGGQFLQTMVHFFMGFMMGAGMFIASLITGALATKAINCISSIAEDALSSKAKSLTVKQFVEIACDAYSDEMGWSFLNKSFEKGLVAALLDELGGKLKDKFIELIKESD